MKNNRKILGMSLIEMMIAIAIFTIGMIGFSMLFTRSWKSNTFIMTIGQSSEAASRGMYDLVSYLRKVRDPGNSGPIQSIAANDLVVFLDYDDDLTVERIHFFLNSGNLKMGIRKPDPITKQYAAGDQTTNIITSNIINKTGESVFAYYDKTNSLTSDLAQVSMVKIFLRVNTNPNRVADDVVLESYAKLRNIKK